MADAVTEAASAIQSPVSPLERAGAIRSKKGPCEPGSKVQEFPWKMATTRQKEQEKVITKEEDEKTQGVTSSSEEGTVRQEDPVLSQECRSSVESKREQLLDAGSPNSHKPEALDRVLCDSCIEVPRRAVKSCLTCLVSYCQEHLRPHLEGSRFQKHRLVEPLRDFDSPACERHQQPLEFYCHTDSCCVCQACASEDHQDHHTVALAEAHAHMEKELEQKQVELVKMVTAAEDAIIKLRNNMISIKSSVADVFGVINEQFSELQAAVGRAQREVREFLEDEERQSLRQAESIRVHLEQKCAELKKAQAQMDKLARSTKNIDALQEYSRWKTSSLDFFLPGVCIGLTDRLAAFSHVVTESTQELCHQLSLTYKDKLKETSKRDKLALKSITKAIVAMQNWSSEPSPQIREDFLKYAANLTLDLNTAHKYLRLTKENRKVTNTTPWQHSYADAPERFEHWRQVLAVESFYLGRHYFEVEAKGEDPHVGVTYKSIARKRQESDGCITGSSSSWCLQWKTHGFSAWHADVETPVSALSGFVRIGIYIDYDGGLLAFYGVADCMTLIHQYQAEFVEPLQPAIWLPKKESAVLMVSPGEVAPPTDTPLLSPPSVQSP